MDLEHRLYRMALEQRGDSSGPKVRHFSLALALVSDSAAEEGG